MGSWLQASSKVTQRIREDNVGQAVILDILDDASGISLDTTTGAITVEQEADYLIVSAPQVGRENPGDTANFRCWLRLNGTNVPDSNVLLNLSSPDVKDVIVLERQLAGSTGPTLAAACLRALPSSGGGDN